MNAVFKQLLRRIRRIYRITNPRHDMRFLWLGGLIGLVSAAFAIVFRESIDIATGLIFQGSVSSKAFTDILSDAPHWVYLVPIMIGSFVAWASQRFAPEAQGHGVPEIMGAMATARGVIRARVSIIKLCVSALSIGSGASVGREGPTALIGATIGSCFGQVLKFPVQKMKMVVGCGTAAGIAATFNAPLAGTAFALELIVGNFGVRYLTPVILSAMMATVVSHVYYGEFHELFIRLHFSIKHPLEIGSYAALGLVAGLFGILFVRILYAGEDLSAKWKASAWLKGAVGGLGVSCILWFLPVLSGPATWDAITAPLTEPLNANLAKWFLVIAILKMIATTWSLSMGSSGGVFAPSLLIGGSLGASYGYYAGKFLPQYTDAPAGYALVGMGAFVAGVTQAPLTAIAIIFEMTDNMTVVLPTIVAGAVALATYNHFMSGSIYTLKLKRKGLNLEWGREVGALENVLVGKVYGEPEGYIDINTPIRDIVGIFKDATKSTLPVVSANMKLEGMVSFWELREFLKDPSAIQEKRLSEIMKRNIKFVTPADNLYKAFSLISSGDYDYLPVVKDEQSRILIGKLSRYRLLQVYKNQLTMRGIIDSEEPDMAWVK